MHLSCMEVLKVQVHKTRCPENILESFQNFSLIKPPPNPKLHLF